MAQSIDKLQQVEKIMKDVTTHQEKEEQDEQVSQPVVSSYVKPDCDKGFTDDKVEITQLQATHLTDVIFNKMMGEFNDDGEYVIENQIIEELANLPKFTVRKDKNGTYCDTKLKEKVLHFCITPYVKKEDGSAYCFLELLEPVVYTNGYVIDTKTTIVATYEYRFQEGFEDYVKIAFNVDQDAGNNDGGRKYLDSDNIVKRIAYLDAMALVSVDLYERLDEAYFNRRIQILNDLPAGALVLAEFNKERAKIEKYFVGNSQRKYKALNDLLSAILDSPSGEKLKQNKEYIRQMGDANKKYLVTVKQIDESAKHSAEVAKALAENEVIEKTGFQVNPMKLNKNVKAGNTQKPMKKAGKSKGPSVPKPDKFKAPKGAKPGKNVDGGLGDQVKSSDISNQDEYNISPEKFIAYKKSSNPAPKQAKTPTSTPPQPPKTNQEGVILEEVNGLFGVGESAVDSPIPIK